MQAFVYAALLGAALFGRGGGARALVSDGGRVWAAMAMIGLLLFVVMFVVIIVVSIVLAAARSRPMSKTCRAAGDDQAAVMAVMTRLCRSQPMAAADLMLFYGAIWLLLTSRLYLAAPASVDSSAF